MQLTQNEWIILGTAVVTAIVVLTVFIAKQDRKDKKKEEALFIRGMPSERLYQLYHALKSSRIFGNYTKRISRKYELLYPALEASIAKATITTIGLIVGLNLLLFSFLFLLNPGIVNLGIVVVLAYVVQTEILNMKVNLSIERLLESLNQGIAELKHQYHVSSSIQDALWQVIGASPPLLQVHLEELYQVLNSPEPSVRVSEYNERSKNKFLKRLLGICFQNLERGNMLTPEGQSVLEENLCLLRKDIFREVEYRKKTAFLFSGLAFVCTAPLAALPFIKDWAVDLMTDFEVFYLGKAGFFVVILSFLFTIACYHSLNLLKTGEDAYHKKYLAMTRWCNYGWLGKVIESWQEQHYGQTIKQKRLLLQLGEAYSPGVLLLRQMASGVISFFFVLLVLLAGHQVERSYLKSDVYAAYSLLPQRVQKEVTLDELRIIQKKAIRLPAGFEEEQELKRLGIVNQGLVQKITEIFEKKIVEISREYMKWYEVLAALFAGALGYLLPLATLYIRKLFLDDALLQEVIQLKAILSTQIYIKGVTRYELLESMEAYAEIYKRSLQACMNRFSQGEQQALKQLQEEEVFPEFQKLVDCFILSDSIGISRAFDEVIRDIHYFQESQELELEMRMRRKENTAWLLAMIPFSFILFAYLMIPFVIFGFGMYNTSFTENMDQLPEKE